MANMAKSTGSAETGDTTTNQTTPTQQYSYDELMSIIQKQQEQHEELLNLVKKTGNASKIAEYEREKRQYEGFAFSMKLLPTDSGNKVVTSWRTLSNFVADEGRITDQKIEITYDADGKEKTKNIQLVDFSRVLLKTPKILAKRLENEDGSEVYIDMKINEETKRVFPVMKPLSDIFYAILEWEGKEYRMPITYLNA